MTDQELYDYVMGAVSHFAKQTGCEVTIVAYDVKQRKLAVGSSGTSEQTIAMLKAAEAVEYEEAVSVN
jgi:hypothetical protein